MDVAILQPRGLFMTARHDKIAEARTLYTDGLTQVEVAAKMGVTRRTVQRWLNESDYDAGRERHKVYLRRKWASRKHQRLTYFVSDGQGHVKIGSTNNVERRMENMQTGNVHELELLATTQQEECELHVKFAHYHVRGEWFVLSDEIKSWIIENQREMPTRS